MIKSLLRFSGRLDMFLPSSCPSSMQVHACRHAFGPFVIFTQSSFCLQSSLSFLLLSIYILSLALCCTFGCVCMISKSSWWLRLGRCQWSKWCLLPLWYSRPTAKSSPLINQAKLQQAQWLALSTLHVKVTLGKLAILTLAACMISPFTPV